MTLTEKELLHEIQTETLLNFIDYNQPTTPSMVPRSSAQQCYDEKLIPFLIEKTHLTDIVNTPLTSFEGIFTIPSPSYHCAEIYENMFLTKEVSFGEVILPHQAELLNGTFIMNVEQYQNEKLERLLPQLLESYPLRFIQQLNQHPSYKNSPLEEAVETYLQTYYLQPLLESVPDAKVSYQITDIVAFTIDLSAVENKNILKQAIPQGNFVDYSITII